MHELCEMSKEDAAGGKTPGRWLTTTPQCQDDADAGEPYRDCAKASLALCLIDIGPGFSKHASAPRGSQNLNVLFFSKQEPCMILFMLLEDWIPKDDAIITSR
jgi:hypothetical protein